MTTYLKSTLGVILFLSASVAVACDYPERPHMPDGATAAKEDLLTAKDAVQSYIAAVDDYLTCIETAEKEAVAALDNPTDEEKQSRDAMISKKFDAANEEKALVGEQFNQQIRAYNAKVKETKE